KPTESEGFEKIIDFLNGSSVSYALTESPTISTSCIKQFWTTIKVKTINDEVRIQALIDENRVNIKEYFIRRTLKLDDAEGTSCLANAEIFDGLAKMGYEKLSENLTFYKAFFSPQWKFVQLLIDHQLGDMSHYKYIYDNPSLTKKVFANMKRVGTGFSGSVSIPIEPSTSKAYKKRKPKKQQTQAPKVSSPEPSHEHRLPSPSNDPLLGGKDSFKLKELMDLCTHLSNKVLELESEVINIKSTYKERIEKLEGRVDRLEEENRVLKELLIVHSKVDTTAPVVEKEKSFKHGRIMADINEDVEINLEEAQAKPYRIDLEHLEKVSVLRRRRGVVIQDPEETTSTVVVHLEVQSKDKGKELNADINWNAVIEQVKRSERLNDVVMTYQALKRKPLTEAQARKNMIIYLKNMAGYIMNYIKGMTYSEIRPLFEKHYNYNQAFLEEVNEEVTVPEKEVEVEGYKREEATPMASKIPIVDYKIHLERNKPYFKIIRADGNHMLFLSFSTLLKNFNREDLESLWKLVKERFKKTEPKNYTDDYLLKTLKTMFEQPDVEANRYPLTHFTLEQMLNNFRLEVEEESEMSLELLRLVRRQLNEGYVALSVYDVMGKKWRSRSKGSFVLSCIGLWTNNAANEVSQVLVV
nr:hypothetical protein [Tanacetum cinerariifolium]GEX85126.1 hypothetical protein [Tanacetum cinerariifolium]